MDVWGTVTAELSIIFCKMLHLVSSTKNIPVSYISWFHVSEYSFSAATVDHISFNIKGVLPEGILWRRTPTQSSANV